MLLSELPLSEASAAARLWAFAQAHGSAHVPGAAYDAIICCCSNDLRVAERAAELYLGGAAPRLVFSGSVGALTAGLFGGRSEAAAFADAAAAAGVPRSAMLLEEASTNTGENARFSFSTLAAAGVCAPALRRILLVQKPYMEMRTLATFLRQWPQSPLPAFAVASPSIPLDAYADAARGLPLEHVIAVAVGDAQRCVVYPRLGFQEPFPMPIDVWHAIKTLIRGGHVTHALRKRGAPAGSRDPADYEGLDEEEPPPQPPPPPSASDAARPPSCGAGGGAPSAGGGGDGVEGFSPSLSAWLAARMAKEVKRLAGAGQRALALRVTATGVLAARREGARVHRLQVDSKYDFRAVKAVLVSPPAAVGDAKPGFAHVFVVFLVDLAPHRAPALIAHYLYAAAEGTGDGAADLEAADLRFFSVVNADGAEALLEVCNAEVVKE